MECLSYLDQHIRCQDILDIFDGSSSLGVMFIRELGGLSSSRLHNNIEPLLDEGLDASRAQSHTAFILEYFFWNANCQLFVGNSWNREDKEQKCLRKPKQFRGFPPRSFYDLVPTNY